MFVKELCDRYGIKSRKSLYTRLDGLKAKGISADLPKDGNKSYATKEQIFFLDQLDEHLKDGGTIKNFVPTKLAEVTALKDTASRPKGLASASHEVSPLGHIDDTATQHSDNPDISSIVETTQHNAQLTTQLSNSPQLLGDIVEAVANALASASTEGLADKLPHKNPLWYMAELERAVASQWLLTTSEVKALIGVKPYCKKGEKTFKRGVFIFVKSGKIGSQTAWQVMKETNDNYHV